MKGKDLANYTPLHRHTRAHTRIPFMSHTGHTFSPFNHYFISLIVLYLFCVIYSLPTKVLENYPVSTYCTAPTAFRIMVQLPTLSKYNYKNLRSTFTAGEPLNPEVIERWFDETGQLIRQAYGQSETVLCSGIYKCIPNKSGSMGKPAPGMDLTIINDDAKEAGYDEEGDIALKINPERPLGLFTRYVDEPEKTAAAFKGDYYLTGDRGMKDEDGYFWYVGRSDDIINSAGYRIGPFEVENALIEHPAVVESAVISSPDETRGEVVKAVIVLSEKYLDADQKQLTKEIQEYVKTHTAPYKYPRKIEFVKELPKTPSSKIKRVELRNKEWGRTQSVERIIQTIYHTQ